MPNVSVTIPEVDQSVSRPIIFDIIDQIRNITLIDKNARILFPGDIQRQQQAGTNIDENTRKALYMSGTILHIEVEENYEDGSLGTNPIAEVEHTPIFADTDTGVYIKPVYASTQVTINFKLRTTSKTDAIKWRDDVRMRAGRMRDIFLHKIHYHYTVQREILQLLVDVHGLRENVAGYGQSFDAYFKSYADTRFTEIGTLTGSYSEMGVAEVQQKIQGIFDFQGAPDKAEKDTENSTWVISFAYKFNYERPVMLNIAYPITIHNQLIPAKYIDFTDNVYDPDNANQQYTKSLGALHNFEMAEMAYRKINKVPYIKIPTHDEYIVTDSKPGTATSMMSLCFVDTDQMTLANLGDLGEAMIDPDILDFIKQSEYSYMTNDYASILQLELYRGVYPASSGTIVCDSSLNVKAVSILDLRKQYRIRLSIVTNIAMLPTTAIDRLRMYPKAFVKLIQSINEAFTNLPGMESLGNQRYVNADVFNKFYKLITGLSFNAQPLPVKTATTQPGLVNGVYITSNTPDPVIDPFKNIRGPMLEQLRMNMISRKTVMATAIVARKVN